jgi:hypothetical protein
MLVRVENTFWIKIYLSGPIEIAKQVIREDCLLIGNCVTIEPTTFIYTGGEEQGYVVGFINYPKFPLAPEIIEDRAFDLAQKLLKATHQQSALYMTPVKTVWLSTKEDK